MPSLSPSPIPPTAPDGGSSARLLQRGTLIIMAVFSVVAMIVLANDGAPRPRTFETYQAQDQRGQPVDCDRLMNDLQPRTPPAGVKNVPTGLVADREVEHHYTFKACRSAIDAQLAQFCRSLTNDILSGDDLQAPLDGRCAAPVRQDLIDDEPSLSVANGWATVNGQHLQLSQIVKVDVQRVSGFEIDAQAPQYLTITTADPRDHHHTYVLHDVATTQRWLHAITGSSPAR